MHDAKMSAATEYFENEENAKRGGKGISRPVTALPLVSRRLLLYAPECQQTAKIHTSPLKIRLTYKWMNEGSVCDQCARDAQLFCERFPSRRSERT